MNITGLISLLLGLLAVAAIVGLYQELRKDVDCHEKRIREQEQRIQKLEQANQKRVNYTTLEEIENAMSGLATLRTDLEIRTDIVDNIVAHLSKAHTPTKR